MAAQAGLAPAPSRLTGGRTTVIRLSKNWSARQDLHLRSLGPKPSVLLLHYALKAPGVAVDAGAGERETLNPGSGPAVRLFFNVECGVISFRIPNSALHI